MSAMEPPANDPQEMTTPAQLSIDSAFASKPKSLPQSIEIVGAGFTAVNGKYSLSPSLPKNKKRNAFGEEKGRVVVSYDKIHAKAKGSGAARNEDFCLWKTEYDDGTFWWTVSWRNASQKKSHSVGGNIYKFIGKNNDEEATDENPAASAASAMVTLPPKVGWRRNGYCWRSIEPVPLIMYDGDAHVMTDWRTECDSDWKIVIASTVCKGKGASAEYHVHSPIVKGMNACNRITTAASHFNLPHAAVEQFPVLLDYLYRGELRMSKENAVILKYLAEYFECEHMLDKVNAHCKEQMRLQSSDIWAVYYKQASQLEMSDMMQLVEKLCRDSFDKLVQDDTTNNDNEDLVAALPLDAWKRILTGEKINEHTSKGASKLMAAIFDKHKADMDCDSFAELTAKLTVIDYSVVKTLIKRELDFMEELGLKPMRSG